jgi:hypothetical protein
MNAALMLSQLHERGIHTLRSGAGGASVTEARFRRAPRPVARHSPPGPACRRLGVAVVTAAARRTDREALMGILSWFRSRRSEDAPDDGRNSLIKYRYEDPDLEAMEKAAAEDVAAVEQDDKYFGRDSPANQDEL